MFIDILRKIDNNIYGINTMETIVKEYRTLQAQIKALETEADMLKQMMIKKWIHYRLMNYRLANTLSATLYTRAHGLTVRNLKMSSRNYTQAIQSRPPLAGFKLHKQSPSETAISDEPAGTGYTAFFSV